MSEAWFHERTEDGWEIRDENRLLVALVPDSEHEREADARLITLAPEMAEVMRVVNAEDPDEMLRGIRCARALLARLDGEELPS